MGELAADATRRLTRQDWQVAIGVSAAFLVVVAGIYSWGPIWVGLAMGEFGLTLAASAMLGWTAVDIAGWVSGVRANAPSSGLPGLVQAAAIVLLAVGSDVQWFRATCAVVLVANPFSLHWMLYATLMQWRAQRS